MKKILILKGSPRRNGNSSALAEQTAAGARASGALVKIVELADMTIQPCTACDYCQDVEAYHCSIDDDMGVLYEEVLQADALIIASPVYWFSINAQTKLFMDRLYALQSSQGLKLTGKEIGIILTYGDSDAFRSGAINALRAFEDSFRFLRCPIAKVVHGTAGDVGDAQKNEPLMQQAYQLGELLAGSSRLDKPGKADPPVGKSRRGGA